LKAAEPADMNICGIEFYKAVIADNVSTWEQFMEWRKNNPLETCYSWRP